MRSILIIINKLPKKNVSGALYSFAYLFYKNLKRQHKNTSLLLFKDINSKNVNNYDIIIIAMYSTKFKILARQEPEKVKEIFDSNAKFKVFWWINFKKLVAKKLEFDKYIYPLENRIDFLSNKTNNKPIIYIPRGVNKNFLHIKNKSKNPVILIDIATDEKNLSFFVKYAKKISKEYKNCKIIFLHVRCPNCLDYIRKKINKYQNIEILNRLPYFKFIDILNKSWIYLTSIDGSYESIVTESQMAGNYVISVNNCTHRELFDKNKTGFIVDYDLNQLLKTTKDIIENYNPEIPRKFAKDKFSWNIVISKFLEEISKW